MSNAALIRAGRCFDAVKFRALDWDEARAAATAAGIAAPESRGDYLLADLFGRASAAPVELAAVGVGR